MIKLTDFYLKHCLKWKCFFAPQGGDLLCEEHVTGPPPLLLQWVKTEHALVMLFNNGTLQVWRNSRISSLKCFNETRRVKKQKQKNKLNVSVTPTSFPSSSASRWTSTRTTPRSSCASHPTTPTCSPTSAASGSHTRTSSACWLTWAAPRSSDTGCGTSSSSCNTTPTPESAVRRPDWATPLPGRPGCLMEVCLKEKKSL